jgi:hypothetical protein
MATIGHRQSLVNQSKTIQHLWLTSRCLLEEVDRQRHKARVVFTQIEWMGLQQELYGSRFTASPVWGRSERSTPSLSSQPSFSPLLSQPSQFHLCEETVINDDLSDYHESEDPLASLLSLPLPPLGTIGNPIVVSDDKDNMQSAQSPKLLWGMIDLHNPYITAPSLSRLYQSTPLSLQLPSIYLWPLPHACPSSSRIWLPELLKPVTSILMGDDVMNNTFLLFFFDMLLPYAFYLTYLNVSLPAGIHELSNTCLTCVCYMVNTSLSHIYHMFNMLFMHVHSTFYYYLNQ